MMNHKEILIRYLVFSAGAVICALGIGFITRAGLGTSPISGIPFVLSLITSPSMGVYTFSFNMLFLLGEALVRAISQKFNYQFGNVKVCFDTTLACSAAILALLSFHRLNGVREGTLISALAVGQLVKLFSRLPKLRNA